MAAVIAGSLSGCLSGASKSSPVSAAAVQEIDPAQPITGVVRFFGYVDVTRDLEDGDQEFEARFGQFTQPIPASVVMEAFATPEAGSCETSTRAKPIVIRDELAFPGNPYQFVSAGPTVRLMHRGRKYTELEPLREAADGDPRGEMITYEQNVDSLGVTFGGLKLFDAQVRTGNLQVLITGDQFPAFGPVAVPEVSELKGFNLNIKDRVKADTVFRWRAGSNPQALVELSAGGGGRAVFCSVRDTGSFQLPPHIRQWLGDKTIPNPEAHREVVAFYRSNEAILVVAQSTYY